MTTTHPRTERHPSPRDGWRVGLNVLLAVSQVGAIVWASGSAFDGDITTVPNEDAAVVPAGYTFGVWGLIYLGSLAYAVDQARPDRRDDGLLRSVGWWTAAAFLASTLWAVAAGTGLLWGTVACMALLLGSLVGALSRLIVWTGARDRRTTWLVDAPIGVYAGYITLAMVANTASVMKQQGVSLGGTETGWATAMLLVAGVIVAATVRASRGNVAYALTAAWGLTGVAVQNALVQPRPLVAAAAAVAAAGSLAALVWVRRGRQSV